MNERSKKLTLHLSFLVLSLLLIIPGALGSISDDLSVCYPFDNNASDYFGVWNGNSTADLDNADYKVGSGCYDFERGNSDRIDVNGWGSITSLQSNWSICAWFKSESTTADQTIWGSAPADYLASNYDTNGLTLYGGNTGDINLVIAGAPPVGSWEHICWVYRDNDTSYIYRNNTLIGSKTQANTAPTTLTGDIGARDGGTNYYDGRIDEFMIWSRALSSSEITELFNSGSGMTCFEVSGDIPETGIITSFIAPTPSDGAIFYNETTDNITASVTVLNAVTSNTTISLYNTSGLVSSITNTTSTNFTHTFDGLKQGTYYLNATNFNSTNASISISETRTIYIYGHVKNGINNPENGSSHTGEYLNITWNATTITPAGTGITISYNVSIYNESSIIRVINTTTGTWHYWNVYDENLSLGEYTIKIDSIDSKNNITEQNATFNLLTNALLNLSAIYAGDNSTIMNFSVNITDRTTNTTTNQNTTEGYILIDIAKERNYTFTLDAEGYAITSENYTSTNMTDQNTTIEAYTENSVLITIYNENTFLIITDNISVTFSSGATEILDSTITGSLYKDDLTDGEWSIKFSGSNYTTKTYTITVNNRSFQYLNAYLSSSYESVILTIQDSSTSSTVEGASVTMERLINSTWTIVENKLSDITGRAQFSYLPDIKYKFTVSMTGYTTKIFYLDPIIFETYTVNIDPELEYSSESDYSDLQIAYYPKIFYNNRMNNITFIISSPTGKLLSYNFSVVAPGGSNSSGGVLANGASSTLSFNISNATIFDRVLVNYSYTTTDGGTKTYRFNHAIIGGESVSEYTIAMIESKDYGMGMFEKAFLVMIGVILLAGFAYMAVGIGGALFVGLIIEGVAVYLGLLPIASILISILAGIAIILASGTGGKS